MGGRFAQKHLLTRFNSRVMGTYGRAPELHIFSFRTFTVPYMDEIAITAAVRKRAGQSAGIAAISGRWGDDQTVLVG
jgi:hypothetical protein